MSKNKLLKLKIQKKPHLFMIDAWKSNLSPDIDFPMKYNENISNFSLHWADVSVDCSM